MRGADSWVDKHKVLAERRGTLGSREQSAFCSRVCVTTVTKGFEEVAKRETYGPPTPSLGVDPGTGVW